MKTKVNIYGYSGSVLTDEDKKLALVCIKSRIEFVDSSVTTCVACQKYGICSVCPLGNLSGTKVSGLCKAYVSAYNHEHSSYTIPWLKKELRAVSAMKVTE